MKTLLFTIVAVVTMNSLSARADRWVSTSDSELSFVAKVNDAQLPGSFNKFDVQLTSDEAGDVIDFTVSIDLSSADLGDADTTATLHSADWFAVAAHPTATFESRTVKKQSEDTLEVAGELALKNTRESVQFPIEFTRTGDTARLSGAASINRNDFSVGSGEWSSDDTVGFIVEVLFDVRLEHVE